jgi:hypothetical protein
MPGPDRFAEMRCQDSKQAIMFSVLSPERRVPQDHPLRPITGVPWGGPIAEARRGPERMTRGGA